MRTEPTATSRECLFTDGTVPLITFGDHCFYRPLSEPLLTAADIDYVAAFAESSTAGVRAPIEAGLGDRRTPKVNVRVPVPSCR